MAKIDLFISNDRHHVAGVLPLAERLRDRHRCRVVSFCELRGLRTPTDRLAAAGCQVTRIPRRAFRRSPAAGGSPGSGGPGALRRAARGVAWRLLLDGPLRRALADPPDLAVLPNDAAFPYDRVVDRLDRAGVPFLLLQEGIRFPLPGEPDRAYGAGGAVAVAAWGEASAEYFRQVGVADSRIERTGSPRFDELRTDAWRDEVELLRQTLDPSVRRLLLVTNPIDDQGLCSTEEKLELVRRFVDRAAPLLDRDLEILLALHSRESAEDYHRALAGCARPHRARVVQGHSLHALFEVSDAVVVMTSTAGLEALLFDRPLGVLEIPGAGFVYDYVDRGAARGLTWADPLDDQIERLLESVPGEMAERFVARNFATRGHAAARVVELIERLTEATDG